MAVLPRWFVMFLALVVTYFAAHVVAGLITGAFLP